MFALSSIIWETDDVTHEYLVEHSYNIKDDLFKTSVKSIQSASYERNIQYVLLKDYQEIELPWSDESGNRAATIIKYKENEENEGEQIIRKLQITKEMGTGVYLLLALENYDDNKKEARQIKAVQKSVTPRTTITFGSEQIKRDQKNIIDISSTEPKDSIHSDTLRPVSIGKQQVVECKITDNRSALSKLDLPICIDLKPYSTSIMKDASAMNGRSVPILILGYLNNNLLPEKYFCEIKYDNVSDIYPGWNLNFDENRQNFLKVFVLCYPFNELDKLENDQQKILYCDSFNAGIYFTKNE